MNHMNEVNLDKYNKAYNQALDFLNSKKNEHNSDEKYMRNQLAKDYEKYNYDPDEKAIRTYNDIECSADGLLSMTRICTMEHEVENIIPTFKQYRRNPVIYFPRETRGINTTRHNKHNDKIDFTLVDLKQFYADKNKCSLLSAYEQPITNKWLNDMGSFKNIVDWLGLKGSFVDDDYNVLDIETGKELIEIPDDKNWSLTYYENMKNKILLWEQFNLCE